MADFESFSLKRRFHCDADMVFALLTEARYIHRATHDRKPFRNLSRVALTAFFDGSISGTCDEVAKDKIVLKWRQRSWKENVFSSVTSLIAGSGSW